MNIKKYAIIAVDFDGTIVEHEYPAIGKAVPLAISTMKLMQEHGIKLILWTMRSGKELTEAVEYCEENDITFWGINKNPQQFSWSKSRKAYAQLYIDDAAFGCPLVIGQSSRPYVDWGYIHTMLFNEGMK